MVSLDVQPDSRRPAVDLSFVFLAAVAVTASAIVCLALRIPTVQLIPGWFWQIGGARVGIVVPAVCTWLLTCLTAILAIHCRRLRPIVRLALVLLTGLILQFGLALSEGRGLEALKDRMRVTGHAEFARTAVREEAWLQITRNYEQFVEMPDQVYARSKPPGQLLLYAAAADIAARAVPLVNPATEDPALTSEQQRLERLLLFASVCLPVASYLVLWPIFVLGRMLLDVDRAVLASLLYVSAAPTALVTMHLDQAVYPLLSGVMLLSSVKAAMGSRRKAAWLAFSASVHWMALFVSFSLLPAAMVSGLSVLLISHSRGGWRRVATNVVGWLSIFLLWAATARLVLDYDAVVAYRRALENHVEWTDWSAASHWWATVLGPIELIYWCGFVMLILVCRSLSSALRFTRLRVDEAAAVVALSTALAIVVTAILGQTKGEFARLWLFFVPLLSLVAVMPLSGGGDVKQGSWRAALLVVQFAWVVALKMFQDFR